MKILWITNIELPCVSGHFGRYNYACGWLDQSSQLIAAEDDIELHVLSLAEDYDEIRIGDIYYSGFGVATAENRIVSSYRSIDPDVIHIWGTEYDHAYPAVMQAVRMGVAERVVISIQGIISYELRHFYAGLPYEIRRKRSLYELVRHTGMKDKEKKWVVLAANELEIFKAVSHCIGRTDWDRACMRQINPDLNYHKCNEILRASFYDNTWVYDDCRPHSIAFSQTYGPLKGLHNLIEAVAIVKRSYPDVTVTVPSNSPFEKNTVRDILKKNSYMEYIAHMIREYDLEDSFTWCGGLDEENMVKHYLRSNVYVCASSIENSSNSVGEAMLLGMPVVASDVGGMKSLIRHEQEGLLYQSDAPYMLADSIMRIFDDWDFAIGMGQRAAERAASIHDRVINTRRMVDIYTLLCAGGGKR